MHSINIILPHQARAGTPSPPVLSVSVSVLTVLVEYLDTYDYELGVDSSMVDEK